MKTTIDPGCGKTYRIHGNKTGHCTRCHQTFHGLAAFDDHQRALTDATTAPYSECLDPAEIRSRDGRRMYERRPEPDATDGFVWAIAISEDARAKFNQWRAGAR